MDRRAFTVSAAALALPASARSAGDPLAALRRGGAVLLLRHAQTEPGVGDPPGFRPGVCSSQRNLSAAGRAQSAAIGRWLAAQGLRPAAVKSSAWCRCLDTATLAFGRVEPWPALDSFFDDRSREPAQTAALREALAQVAAGGFEVWVTHMVNILALSGESVASAEGVVVRAAAGKAHNVGRLQLPGGTP